MADESRRQLTLLDCVGLGVNCVVGSGVYLLLAPMAKAAGAASVIAIVACALLCVLIALCFAELAGMFDQNGGTLLYAREAFGSTAAFAIGWMAWVSCMLGFSAVAVGFGEAAGRLEPRLAVVFFEFGPFKPSGRTALSVALIGVLGFVNWRGVKAGARTSDALSVAKLLPLIAVALVGLAYLKRDVAAAVLSAPSSTGFLQATSSAAFIAIFMLSGFEYVPVPAGEAADSKRTVPLAILFSLLGAAGLYALLQLVALSVLGDGLATNEHPLVDVARALFGPAGASVVLAASLISMAGFCAASAMVAPRYLAALAALGWLPAGLEARNTHAAPGRAIGVVTAVAGALAFSEGYGALVDVANVAVFAQYLPACLAVVVLRVKRPEAPRRFRLPFGPLVPLLASAVSVALLAIAQPKAEEWLAAFGFLVLGVVVWAATRVSLSLSGRRA